MGKQGPAAYRPTLRKIANWYCSRSGFCTRRNIYGDQKHIDILILLGRSLLANHEAVSVLYLELTGAIPEHFIDGHRGDGWLATGEKDL